MEPDDTRPTQEQMVEAANRIHRIDGEVEIDSNAEVSWGDDNGAYVQAWVWVPFSEVIGGENHG